MQAKCLHYILKNKKRYAYLELENAGTFEFATRSEAIVDAP